MRDTLSRFRRAAVWLATSLPASAGAQWRLAPLNTAVEFRGLSVASDKVAWASGAHGTFARTVDGGMTWTVDTVSGAGSLDLRSIVGLTPDIAVAASAGPADSGRAKIYRTADAGKSWTLSYSTDLKGVFLDAMAFWDPAHGMALSDPVDGRLFLLTTADGGRSWTRVPPEVIPPALSNEAAFAASGTCIAVWGDRDVWIGTGGAATARVFHSADRGRTWTVADTPVHAGNAQSGIFAVAFRDRQHGVAVGGDYSRPRAATMNVALTDDGGRSWRAATGPLSPAYLSGVAYAGGAATVVAIGLAGTYVSINGGDAWARVDTIPFNAVRFHGETFGVAVGPRGRVARFVGSPALFGR